MRAHPVIMLFAVAGHPQLRQDLPRDTRNTARETRARFEYQDACVVLRCIPNLIPGSIEAVVIEWTTDYVVLGGMDASSWYRSSTVSKTSGPGPSAT